MGGVVASYRPLYGAPMERARVNNCPKCQGAMETGFIPDASYGAILLSNWTEGAAEKNFLQSIKLKGRRQIPLTAERCTQCGFVELYARP